MKISERNGYKKKLGGINMLNYSNELGKLSEGSGSRSTMYITIHALTITVKSQKTKRKKLN